MNEELALDLPEGEYETLAGLMIEKLEKIPAPGDQVTLNGYRLTVKEGSKRKINSIILRKIASEYPPKPSAQSSAGKEQPDAASEESPKSDSNPGDSPSK